MGAELSKGSLTAPLQTEDDIIWITGNAARLVLNTVSTETVAVVTNDASHSEFKSVSSRWMNSVTFNQRAVLQLQQQERINIWDTELVNEHANEDTELMFTIVWILRNTPAHVCKYIYTMTACFWWNEVSILGRIVTAALWLSDSGSILNRATAAGLEPQSEPDVGETAERSGPSCSRRVTRLRTDSIDECSWVWVGNNDAK